MAHAPARHSGERTRARIGSGWAPTLAAWAMLLHAIAGFAHLHPPGETAAPITAPHAHADHGEAPLEPHAPHEHTGDACLLCAHLSGLSLGLAPSGAAVAAAAFTRTRRAQRRPRSR
ncbi:MAG: hypothetical protein MI723_00970, partial [Caulobacterales bacterium]|nr:hypothetical protein [Caulobacterales bacterium]